jgi:hypothetical protein
MARARIVPELTKRMAERSRNTSDYALRRKLRASDVRKQNRCCQNPAD